MAKRKTARRSLLGEEDLSTRLALQSTALAAAANGVVITDRAGSILWVNPAFTALTGYQAEEVIGATMRLLKSDRHDEQFYRDFWQTIVAGKVWRGEFANRRKDGTIYFNDETVTPVRVGTGEITHFVGVMQDVTERKQAEEQIRALNEHLEKRVRQRTAELEGANQELEAFAYSVSHDLRAPLRHINAFVDLLLKSAIPALSAEEQRYLSLVASSAKQMDRLIDDLLQFSRMAQTQMHPDEVDLNRLVEEVIQELKSETKERTIEWKRDDLPIVCGDCAMLRQVLVNLCSNAVKYTGPREVARIEISGTRDEKEVTIAIRDNGVGFDMRFADKLFGVFQRLHPKDQFEGTGVGLANVRRIIVRHGGRTWAEGKPNGGATFYFTLPQPAER